MCVAKRLRWPHSRISSKARDIITGKLPSFAILADFKMFLNVTAKFLALLTRDARKVVMTLVPKLVRALLQAGAIIII